MAKKRKLSKQERKRERAKRKRKAALEGVNEQATKWSDTGLSVAGTEIVEHLKGALGDDRIPWDDIEKEGWDVKRGANPDKVFGDSPAMLAAAAMGAFGPTAKSRAEGFARSSKAHSMDIGGVPYSAMGADGMPPGFEDRQRFKREVMDPSPKKTIANYLTMTEHFRAASLNDEFVSGGGGKDSAVQLVRQVWARLRQARIFDLPPYAYSQAHHLSDRYTTEVLAGLPWHHPLADTHPTKEEGEKMATMYLSHVNEKFWFEHMPFETTYIGFGAGVPMSPLMADTRNIGGDFSECFLMGLLISEADQNVYEMIIGKNHDGTIATTIGRPCEAGVWRSPMTMMRWISPMILDLINEYRTIVLEQRPTFGMRRDWKKSGKRQGKSMPIPQPYYIVNLKQKIIDERMRRSVSGMSRTQKIYGHRWDVRGHECVKIQRGMGTLSPKDEKKLLQKKYRIYTRPGSIPPADYHRMLERKHGPLRQGEWIAVLSWWRESFVKGPQGAPYIPAIRKPARVKKPTMH